MFRQSIEVAAEPGVLFDLTQDYAHRLDWDPFLKEARLLGGAESRASVSGPGAWPATAWAWRRSTSRSTRRGPAPSR